MVKDIFVISGMTIYGQSSKNSVDKRQQVSKNQKNAVKISQKGRCFDCKKILVVEDYHHVKHVANNGKSTTDNLVALCPECHRKRHINEAANKTDKKRKSTSTNKSPFGIKSPSIKTPSFRDLMTGKI